MFDKLGAFINLFRKGSEVANVEAWKTGQITGTVVGALIIAIVNVAASLGHSLPIDVDTANLIGGGIVAAANVVLTATTSTRAGLLPAKPADPAPVEDHSSPAPVPAVAATKQPAAVQPVRHARNGDPLDGLDTTYIG
ncbi:hypothetical protein QN372_00880 [Undibacterium sp. RTI2.1]|uniref:hypothetical protein n=1 Tax=unclassified Undibacterium TaxID=2630295 RepID=UPI002AB3E376|nr:MULTISPECIES: hypothetical protein [unclassified Undibacterium]MDY7537691.1 hypothetical protein [Undibacterium sp. 5I1]MEB0029293.1 hypothetical protein [Undibacterium sp. RTI2.1]MEB0115601.1 hypothetical protein [Undibacterium sp. RTI2.2]MEB0256428.1 hypothetical protein [Undibacterium sp. 5I1]